MLQSWVIPAQVLAQSTSSSYSSDCDGSGGELKCGKWVRGSTWEVSWCWAPAERAVSEHTPRAKEMGEDVVLRRAMETNDWAITRERNRTDNIR